MYSGTTLRNKSGRIMGVHQRIDRVARKQIGKYLPDNLDFPDYNMIVHFEGKNGPDGIKRKSPAQDEPWHFIDPNDASDTTLMDMVDEHILNMKKSIKHGDKQRTAFEAAWMAHAITDGLTPAHHYPLDKKLEELRGGLQLDTRNSTKEKLILPGDSASEMLKNNWEYWGAKGVMTTHLAFEAGVALAISSSRLKYHPLNYEDIERVRKIGFRKEFVQILTHVDSLDMYNKLIKSGWNRELATQARRELVPLIIRTVALGWCESLIQSGVKLKND